MQLKDLEVYKLAREASRDIWKIYDGWGWQDKKLFGDQLVGATDSIGANIAEGFGRFHYLDKNKFNYNARGSLLEAIYWLDTATERGRINNSDSEQISAKFENLHKKLNSYINVTKKQTV